MRHRLVLLATLSCLLASTPDSVRGQEPSQSGLEPIEAEAFLRRGPTDPIELEAFADGLMEVLLEEYNTAGAVVTVVSDGEIFFSKGYGYADWEARAPVDPATTLFRIGSVSKLFVWTSVMQAVERGLLDLDTDINEYLDFEIPATFEDPITMGDLMAHAAGFEDRVIGLFTDGSEPMPSLEEIFQRQLPARVRPAGDIASYSNHGTGLAAYIVERVTGTDWNDFVEESLLQPLGMDYATFRQPLPDELEPYMSKGYVRAGSRFREEDFEFIPLYPVGAASVSGENMARFMIAHLQGGRLGDERILSEETARLMQTDHHTQAPGLNAMVHGFADHSRNGERIIGHGGDTRLFHTGLWLLPEHDLGVFVSFNSAGGGGARGEFFEPFMDRYFPVEEANPGPPDDFAESGKRFAGTYRANRFPHTTLARLAAVMTQDLQVTERGTLRGFGAEWIQVDPLTFQEQFGSRKLVFREDQERTITHAFVSTAPYMAMERVPTSDHPTLNLAVLVLALVCAGLTLLLPMGGWAVRRWHGVALDDAVRIPRTARLSLRVSAVLFLAATLIVLVSIGPGQPPESPVSLLGFALGLFLLGGLATLASVGSAVRLWLKGDGRFTVRVTYTVAALSFCLFLWQLNNWNLLGWKF